MSQSLTGQSNQQLTRSNGYSKSSLASTVFCWICRGDDRDYKCGSGGRSVSDQPSDTPAILKAHIVVVDNTVDDGPGRVMILTLVLVILVETVVVDLMQVEQNADAAMLLVGFLSFRRKLSALQLVQSSKRLPEVHAWDAHQPSSHRMKM
jgi:hypothetical protein